MSSTPTSNLPPLPVEPGPAADAVGSAAEPPGLPPILTLRDVRLPTGSLRLAEAGAGRPVMFLHGVAGTHAYWTPTLEAVGASRRALAPDVPGFGASRPLSRGWSLEAAADVIAALATATGHPRLDLVGHSLGGALAAMVAIRHPRLVDRLVLVAPIGFRPMPPRPTWRLGILTRARAALLPVAAMAVRHPPTARRLVGGVVQGDTELDHSISRALIDGSLRARRTAAAGMDVIRRDLTPAARLIDRPTLVIWGRRDGAVPVEYARDALGAIPGSRVVILDGSGHLPMLDEPAAFARAVLDFIGREPAPGGDPEVA
jgi:pimeloyl-ACP methyl ester carboxylesterase